MKIKPPMALEEQGEAVLLEMFDDPGFRQQQRVRLVGGDAVEKAVAISWLVGPGRARVAASEAPGATARSAA